MAAHRYWRILLHENNTAGGHGDVFSIAEVAASTTVGGANVLTGGTPSASSTTGGFVAANAFDANAATFWASADASDGNWLKYDLGGSPADIVEITITARNGFNYQCPTKFEFQYSDDNVNWTTLLNRVTPGWGAGEVRSFNTTPTTGIRSTFDYGLVAQNFPSQELRSTDVDVLTVSMFDIGIKNTGMYNLVAAKSDLSIRVTETYALVAILAGAEERMLRAWTFTQDDHDFYVLLANNETYIYDKLSDQWCQWLSPDSTYWRAVDGCDWNGINVCIDPDNGKLYQIDAINRLDYNTTPITSVIYGGMTERFRNKVPCYMAEVAISQAQPPVTIDATTLGITLETSDTVTWTNHGTVQGQAVGNKITARFYGLGLMQSPGTLFKITDTGYARRIDGLNIEVRGTPDGS